MAHQPLWIICLFTFIGVVAIADLVYAVVRISGRRFTVNDDSSVFSRRFFNDSAKATIALFFGLGTIISFAPLGIICFIIGGYYLFRLVQMQIRVKQKTVPGVLRAMWLYPLHAFSAGIAFPVLTLFWFLLILGFFHEETPEEEALRIAYERQRDELARKPLW
jgi:hypothetical protein